MKIKINVLFWQNEEDSQRLKNVNLSWFYLKKFCEYAKTKDLDVEAFLFDFSEFQVLGEAIHLPYEKGSYKRSHKINDVIEYHSNEECYFSIMDSDIIFKSSDYDTLIYLLKKLKDDKFYVFRVDDVQSMDGLDYDNNNIEFINVKSTPRNYEPDLGGFFVMNIKLLQKAGRFSEEFIIWGGEDCDLSYKIQDLGYKKIILPILPLHLPHQNLSNKVMGTAQYKKQYDIVMKNRKNYR